MDLQNSFTAAKSSKFPTKLILGYPPHLKYVAALPCRQYTIIHITHTKLNLPKHSEMRSVRQNPIQRTVRSVHICVHRTVHNCCTQYCTEQTWQFSLLHSRQSPLLRWCLFEGRRVEEYDINNTVMLLLWQLLSKSQLHLLLPQLIQHNTTMDFANQNELNA